MSSRCGRDGCRHGNGEESLHLKRQLHRPTFGPDISYRLPRIRWLGTITTEITQITEITGSPTPPRLYFSVLSVCSVIDPQY